MFNHPATIRAENTADVCAIGEVHRLAFERDNEARLVEALRSTNDFIPELSLVAELEGRVVGHILFTRIGIERQQRHVMNALALAPLAVLPAEQNKSFGSQMVRAGLDVARTLAHGLVIVIGHPEFYSRFGFRPARASGLQSPFEVPDEAFMLCELFAAAARDAHGLVKYPAPYLSV